jgi:hypothetical protein
MTHHDHHDRQRGMDRDENSERGHPGNPADQQRSSDGGSSVQDRGEYGGIGSGEGQGEFAGDGYSAQGEFSNQRVAQYGDQGYGQDYGREGIGWQNRQESVQGEDQSNKQSKSRSETQRDEPRAGTSNS